MSDTTAFNFIFFGTAVSVTSSGVISVIGLLVGVAGVVIGLQRNAVMRKSRIEATRANDLKERELNIKMRELEDAKTENSKTKEKTEPDHGEKEAS